MGEIDWKKVEWNVEFMVVTNKDNETKVATASKLMLDRSSKPYILVAVEKAREDKFDRILDGFLETVSTESGEPIDHFIILDSEKIVKSLVQNGDFAAWILPSYFEPDPLNLVRVVLEGKLNSDIAAFFEREMNIVIESISPGGCLILHGEAGDILYGDDFFHSEGLEKIDGTGWIKLINLSQKASAQQIGFALVISSKVESYVAKVQLNRIFTVLNSQKDLAQFLASSALPA